MRHLLALIFAGLIVVPQSAPEAKTTNDKETEAPEMLMSAGTFKGLALRGIGPAFNSGRVGDIAVNPNQPSHYFVAACSGGVWKTVNSGTTWTPVFDEQGSYSIGCVTMDPTNPSVVWVGTGENNSQRSVSFGDGVYKSLDGGKNWKNMGLKSSEHIGMITIDPRDPDVVYVAAQGPLWKQGGERGLYKTSDGGETWELILSVDEHTGVNEVHMDPRDPDLLYATTYQRRRRVWTLINGGPGSAIYKSTDAGATWRKLEQGLPKVDMGRIGIDISPANPDSLYAIIEAVRDEGGVFRSEDRGETWTKRGDYLSGSPQYYNELVCDPADANRVYSLDTWLHVSTDGGKTFHKVGERHKHVDNHALWIDPNNTDYLLAGCDGGVYESFDRGQTWHFKANLPITQFYRVAVDQSVATKAQPFYYVYGGTQDNNTLGGPSRTLNRSGISNEDWFVTVGGDGYEPQVDPTNPNIVYSMWQYGGLVRYDRASGETVDIQPQENPSEDPHRWNWDSPLIISPHNPRRLYFAAQKLFRSDDRGNSWQVVAKGKDLTRQIDRDTLPVMGKLWGPDAVAKSRSTSPYGNIVSLTESPEVEGLIYVGTDDGLIQVIENGELTQTIDQVDDVPKRTYVSCLTASRNDENTVFATFDNHKNGDFKPYVFKSTDRGLSWTSITGDLPERDIVYSLAEDHVSPGLLFVGTEFGLYFTVDGGDHWVRLKGGLPTIAVRDIDIQRNENDLALATFGRGFYILDDYTALRAVSEEILDSGQGLLFAVKQAPLYIPMRSRQGSRGHSFFTAPNPPFGATFTYYLKEGLKTSQEDRIEAEKQADKEETTLDYPDLEDLRKEDREEDPQVVLIVRDDAGAIVRRVIGERSKGFHRSSWDLRYPTSMPTELEEKKDLAPWDRPDVGPLVQPGTYKVTMYSEHEGTLTEIAGPQEFKVKGLDLATLPAKAPDASFIFQKNVADLQRAVEGAKEAAKEAEGRLDHLTKAVIDTPTADPEMLARIHRLKQQLADILLVLRGDRSKSSRNIPTSPSISGRVSRIVGSQWYTTSGPTQTLVDNYDWASEAFAAELEKLGEFVADLSALEAELEQAGGPWTPGRLPTWKTE